MTGKKCLNLFVTVGFVFCLTLNFLGCNNPKTITDYPGNELVSDNINETEEDIVNVEKETDYYLDDEEELEDFMPNDYAFDGQGNFIYNPVALRPGLANGYRNKPEFLEMAKQIMLAVDQGESMLQLKVDVQIDEYDFEEALKIACLSNPCVYAAKFETEDYHTFTIKYPDYFGSLDEHGQVDRDNYIDDDKNFSAEMDEFKSFVNEVIEENVNYQDNDMENARRVYKYLVENLYIEDKDSNYYQYNPDSTTGRPFLHIDVVRNLKNDRLYLHEVIKLYQFILTQLNIYTVLGYLGGEPALDRYKPLLEKTDFMTGFDCVVVRYDGVDYLCNLYFDYLDYHNFPMYDNDTECHCCYFAIGKETCRKTYYIETVGYSGDMEYSDYLMFSEPKVDYPFDDRVQ